MNAKLTLGLAIFVAAAASTSASDGKWKGWITDSHCGAEGAHPSAKECAPKCVKEKGAKYVFVNDKDKKVYIIDVQDQAAPHAGEHVIVKGSIDGDTLKMTSIQELK